MDENLGNSESLIQLETKQSEEVAEGTSWDCSVCTYKNTSEAFKCLMCDVRKGTSTRKPRLNQQIVAQQVAQQFGPTSGPKKPGSKKVPRKFRPRLKNVDRNSAQEVSVTVGNVTVIITDYKLLQSDDGRILSESLLSNSTSDDSLEGPAIMYPVVNPTSQVTSVES